MPSPTMTLHEKVRAVFMTDTVSDAALNGAHAQPAAADLHPLSQWELDLRDWGAVYGVAFGIARTEEPFESIESVAARALNAARTVYAEWGGGTFAPRNAGDVPDAARAVLRAYMDDGPKWTESLARAIDELSEAVGCG